jgi:hypothetical protein
VVEAALADHLWHVAVLMEEAAGLLEVGAEEGGGHQGNGHHLGGREPDLRIVLVVDGLQELLTQAVDCGYGIVHDVLPVRRRF